MSTHNDEPNEHDPQKIEAILSGIDRLPTLPSVATRLLSIGNAEDINLDEIIQLIESDPAMSTTILRMCRSADKGLGDRISTVRRAVIMLGLESVQVAALSVHVYQQLNQGDEQGDFDRPGFWIHSLAVACGAESIARDHPQLGVSPEQAYLAGLLHDLGKVALDLTLPKAYSRALEMSRTKRCALCLVEHTMFGIDHHTAGKRLAEHWDLPEAVRDSMWLHSQPISSLPEGASRSVVSLITIAESWARDMHLGWSGDYGQPLDLYDLAQQTGIDPGYFKNHTSGVIESVAARGEILGLGEHAEQDLLIESLTGANRRLAQLNTELRRKADSSKSLLSLLGAIDAFNAATRPGDDPQSVYAAMVHSASILVATARAAVIYQHNASASWETMIVDQGKVIQPAKRVDGPSGEHGPIRPGALSESGVVASLDLSRLSWLRDLFVDVRQVGTPMLLGSSPDPADERPSFLIVMPKSGSGIERVIRTPEFASVRSLWEHTLMLSIQAQKSRRLGEELAAANHTLTALRHELTSKESLVQLGKMAAGAAHEMNNPLSVIRGRSQQLFERLGTVRDRDSARSISAAADQLSDLITALHMIADPPKPKVQPGDPVLLVRQAIELARSRCITQGLRPRVQLQAKGFFPSVPMDVDLLAQALCEPIINAIQVNPESIVTVSIESASSNGRISIRICDEGPGFTEKTIKHAFDPFFSELPAGRRSGLGLSRARGLIELHKGEIELGNRPGKRGAQVVVHLDTSEEATKAA